MAHPKSRISKQRKRKRRTHDGVAMPQLAKCPTTQEVHLYHHAYAVEGNLYYRGNVLIKAAEETD